MKQILTSKIVQVNKKKQFSNYDFICHGKEAIQTRLVLFENIMAPVGKL